MSQNTQSRRTRKIAAVAAGALVVGLGAAYTLASWTDSEWVWGGVDGEANIGTSNFNVQQNTGAGWTDAPTNPGGELVFSTGSLALTPGDSVYAPVSLRTVINSIDGDVTLQEAEAADGVDITDAGGLLWDAIGVTVYTSEAETAPSCTATGVLETGWTAVAGVTDLDTEAIDSQRLAGATAAEPGAPQHYCFVLTLPNNEVTQTLQGRTIAPAWEFAALSD